MAVELNAVHVERFPLLPVGTAKQSVDRGKNWCSFTAEEDLQPHFPQLGCWVRRHGLQLLSHGQKVIEANEAFAGAFVVTAVALEVIETIAFQRRSDDREHSGVHTDLLDADVIRFQHLMLKALLLQPLAHRPSCWGDNRRGVLGGGRRIRRGFTHNSTASGAGVRTAASVASV